MKEVQFVKQNSEKWRKFEELQDGSADGLANYYIEITDDLAYSKTFYPDSKTTLYLNGLASRFHQNIYQNKKESKSRIIDFWRYELPLLFKQYERSLLYSLIFFVISFAIGSFSAKYDSRFVNLVLGDHYVAMTKENIAKGDPFGVYKQSKELPMLIMIAMNNIQVSAITFVAGIFFSVGTLMILFKNGIILGSFQYFFFAKGLGIQSVLVIWIHGTLEISALVIAGAAGLILGNGLLFPGTYPRMVSLKRGAKDGLKIIIGLSPVFFTAAVFESYITRKTEMPVWLSASILICSATFIIWYTYIYPNILYHKQRSYEKQF